MINQLVLRGISGKDRCARTFSQWNMLCDQRLHDQRLNHVIFFTVNAFHMSLLNISVKLLTFNPRSFLNFMKAKFYVLCFWSFIVIFPLFSHEVDKIRFLTVQFVLFYIKIMFNQGESKWGKNGDYKHHWKTERKDECTRKFSRWLEGFSNISILDQRLNSYCSRSRIFACHS